LIFGLSLSIGSIALVASSPTSTSEIGSHIAAFAFTFLILITWIVYTTDMSVIPTEAISSSSPLSQESAECRLWSL